ncbi:hypothetical protein [Campylobacter novaezeelandiae]|uniref:hypothetical protein n=1 Tax=Campylobacter novaezeelandiae TaxID=2267891 RepID=UPI0019051E06|nr:hypothetical protein [Campylobacter novaezeelandiae]MBK1963639.1 hypothetical protein [Campylobacter novaezeelandiae]
MKYLEEFQTSNQISFLFFSKNSFSDEKNLKAWSLNSHRLDMREWFEFKNQNLGKFYNVNLEKILNALMQLNSYFKIDKFRAINLHGEDDYFDFNEASYLKIYDRLCQDQSKFHLYQKLKNKSLRMGSLYNFSPNFPFWNASGKNFSQSEINTFISDKNLAPFFNSSDVYFNSCLVLNYNITKQMLDYLVKNYNAKFKNQFLHKKPSDQMDNKNKILEELKDIFLLLCNGMNADYAFMDFTYFFSGYDYTIDSKNSILNPYLKNFKDIVYKDTMIDAINEYGKNFFINYYSKEVLSLLDKDELLDSRMNVIIKNYQQDLNGINSKGILSQRYENDFFVKLVPFIEWESYVYDGDIWQLYEKKNEEIRKYWKKFLSRDTLKPLPLEWDCSINEKLIWVNDNDLFQALNAHKILHQN